MRSAAAVAAAIALSGCAGGIGPTFTAGPNLNALKAAQPTGTPFTQALTREYTAAAQSEYDQADWWDADHFARKGLAAAGGEMVMPDDVASRNIAGDKAPEITQARARLVRALDATARDKATAPAAVAQVKYDCWLEQLEEGWQLADIQACRDAFLQSMDAVELALAPPAAAAPAPVAQPAQVSYFVFFDWDRSNLTPAAMQIIDQVVAESRQKGGQPRIAVIGHADRSGSDQYNVGLSQRRADAVRDALAQRGIPAGNITTQAVGEGQPLVPTPDGVREPSNRRAEIRTE
ncbi:MAG TPA: OmpA family protein [Alphaproteobacteria bacterium]|nr:OmpA family protein [Alphaproteobacteria bacterium]